MQAREALLAYGVKMNRLLIRSDNFLILNLLNTRAGANPWHTCKFCPGDCWHDGYNSLVGNCLRKPTSIVKIRLLVKLVTPCTELFPKRPECSKCHSVILLPPLSAMILFALVGLLTYLVFGDIQQTATKSFASEVYKTFCSLSSAFVRWR